MFKLAGCIIATWSQNTDAGPELILLQFLCVFQVKIKLKIKQADFHSPHYLWNPNVISWNFTSGSRYNAQLSCVSQTAVSGAHMVCVNRLDFKWSWWPHVDYGTVCLTQWKQKPQTLSGFIPGVNKRNCVITENPNTQIKHDPTCRALNNNNITEYFFL